MKRKYVLLLVIMVLSLALTGCSSKDDEETVTNNDSEEAQAEAEETGEDEPIIEEEEEIEEIVIDYDLVYVYTPDDGRPETYYRSTVIGIYNFIENNPESTITRIEVSEAELDGYERKLEGYADEYDAVVCSAAFASQIAKAAGAKPDGNFILVDAWPLDEDGEVTRLGNVYGIRYQVEENGFYAGMIAALETKTGFVGVAADPENEESADYTLGFLSGVSYVNEIYQREVICIEAQLPENTGYQGDEEEAEDGSGSYRAGETAREMIGRNCDVIYAAASSSWEEIFQAAAEGEGVRIIGCEADLYEYDLTDEERVILTTTLKKMGNEVKTALDLIVDDIFFGRNALQKTSLGGISYVGAKNRQLMSSDTKTKVSEAKDLVAAGSIIPASVENGYTPEDFPGLFPVEEEEIS